VRFSALTIAAAKQFLGHQQVTLHLSQHHENLRVGADDLAVAGFTALAPFTTLGELAGLRLMQVLRPGLRCRNERGTDYSDHAEAQKQLDGAGSSGHSKREAGFIVLALPASPMPRCNDGASPMAQSHNTFWTRSPL
jgi:hypothetical protein